MNALEMEQVCVEWRQLTEAEGRAIAANDWIEVQRQQQRKENLKCRLLSAAETWRSRWSSSGETHAEYERKFRPIIAELISLETINAQMVAARRESARCELAECNRTTGILRDLNRTYGTSTVGSWTSYS